MEEMKEIKYQSTANDEIEGLLPLQYEWLATNLIEVTANTKINFQGKSFEVTRTADADVEIDAPNFASADGYFLLTKDKYFLYVKEGKKDGRG